MERLILFDDECIFCNRSMQFIYRRDKRKIFFFSSLNFYRAMAKSEKVEFDGKGIVYIRDGQVFKKSPAVVEIAYDLGRLYKVIGSFLKIIPISVLDFCYDLVAKNRYRISKNMNCAVPTADMRSRILG